VLRTLKRLNKALQRRPRRASLGSDVFQPGRASRRIQPSTAASTASGATARLEIPHRSPERSSKRTPCLSRSARTG